MPRTFLSSRYVPNRSSHILTHTIGALVLMAACVGGSGVLAQSVTSSPNSTASVSNTQSTIRASQQSQILAFAFTGQNRALRDILAPGVSPDSREEPGGWTPLMMASFGNFADATDILLKAGARADLSRRDGQTALMIAALIGAKDVATLLIPRSTIDARDEIGNSALAYAALNGHADIIALLIGAGAHADTTNKRGQTPLHLAAASGQLSAVDALLLISADRDARDASGATPLDLAMTNQRSAVIRRLLEAGATASADHGGRDANGRL